MNVEVRIYKRYDTDLLSLHDAGYSVTRMMTEAVSAYANGQPCHFFIDEVVPFDMNDKKSVRLRLKFKKNDTNSAALIQNIKHGYRSNFCKQVLRNALVQQNLFCYFSNTTMLPLHEANANTINMLAFPGIKKCSDYRRMVQQYHIMGQNITVQQNNGYRLTPPTQPTPQPAYNNYQVSQTFNNAPAPAWTPQTNTFAAYQQPLAPNTEVYYNNPVTSTPIQTPQPQFQEAFEQPIIQPIQPPLQSQAEKTFVEQEVPNTAPKTADDAALMNIFDNM